MTKFSYPVRTLSIGCLFLLLTHSGFSASDAKVDELLIAIKAERNVAALKQSADVFMANLVKQAIVKARLSTTEVKKFKLALDQKTRPLLKDLEWEDQKPRYTAIYKDAFSDEEIDELLAFYRSPIGKKYMERQEDINRKKAEVTRDVMTEFEPKLRAAVDEVVAEVRAMPKADIP